MNNGWRIGTPTLIAFGAVVTVIVALLAGYGVPVGLGMLAGLILGGIAGISLGLWVGAKGGGRSISFGSMNMSSTAELDGAPIADMFQNMERVQGVDRGALVRIVAGGTTSKQNGITVELIVLEIRSAGAVAHVTAASAPPDGRAGSFARVTIEDDVGTRYVAAGTSANGSSEFSRYELPFAPAPPSGATSLVIRIDEFVDPFPMRGFGSAQGPWTLRVDLRHRGESD